MECTVLSKAEVMLHKSTIEEILNSVQTEVNNRNIGVNLRQFVTTYFADGNNDIGVQYTVNNVSFTVTKNDRLNIFEVLVLSDSYPLCDNLEELISIIAPDLQRMLINGMQNKADGVVNL